MENNIITQVEEPRLAWFNGNNLISIGTMELNHDAFCDVPDYVEFDLIKAIQLKNQLDVAINDYLSIIKELYENN